jgi:GAF domain-containing protein
MGSALAAFFTEADKIGGMLGKLQLAGIVKMTSTQASSTEDTPELIRAFEDALYSIKQQSKKSQPSAVEVKSITGEVRTLRKHIEIYLDLMSQRALVLGDTASTVRRVNEAASSALDCERVSVWLSDPTFTKITCADLYERTPRRHSAGVELFAKDFPPYFEAIKKERTIAAHDAHRDPRTACFSEPYLKPLGINSMLDVPIWVNEKMIGVICHEHIGPARAWNSDEEKFAYLMSTFIALSIERKVSS